MTEENKEQKPKLDRSKPHVHGPHCNHGPSGLKPITRDIPKVGRNEPCPCLSGKKYKKCHGK